jgi:predicted esterase
MTPAPAIPTPVVDEAAPTPVPAPEAPPAPIEAPAVPAAPEVAPASEGSGIQEPAASEGSGIQEPAASEGSGTAATPADVWSVRFEGRSGRVGIETAPGRDGSFFVPDVPAGQPVPVVVLIHGPGGSGAEIARRFEPLARHFGFAIVAPDASSQLDGLWAWMRSRRIADRTPDAEHVMRSIEWVESTTGVRFDRRRVLVAGYSQGSKAAAWLGSNEELFTHVAVLHGGVSVDAMGWHDAAYWLSTTRGDSFRNPVRLNRTADSVATAGFGRLTVRIFDGGDALTRIEIEGLIRWFLGA